MLMIQLVTVDCQPSFLYCMQYSELASHHMCVMWTWSYPAYHVAYYYVIVCNRARSHACIASAIALILPYSGKHSREKTFTTFVVFEPSTKFFCTKCGCTMSWHANPITGLSIPRKFSLQNGHFLPIRKSFLPRKFAAKWYVANVPIMDSWWATVLNKYGSSNNVLSNGHQHVWIPKVLQYVHTSHCFGQKLTNVRQLFQRCLGYSATLTTWTTQADCCHGGEMKCPDNWIAYNMYRISPHPWIVPVGSTWMIARVAPQCALCLQRVDKVVVWMPYHRTWT